MKVWLAFITTIIATPLYARIGCLDKSKHLQVRYDYKTYHYVHCNCPCEQAYELTKQSVCTQCDHRRDEVLVHCVTTDPRTLINISALRSAR